MTDYPRLIADVGGTNARFAIEYEPLKLQYTLVLPCKNFPTLLAAINDYLSECENLLDYKVIKHFVIAIANPVTGDEIKMTNHHWQFSIAQMKATLQAETLLVINDFTAQAQAVTVIADEYLVQVGGKTIPSERKNTLPVAVVGPGTGLGVSGLIPDGSGNMIPLAGEGGHIAFAARDAVEREILAFAEGVFNDHVSAERLLQGAGLPLLYHFFAETKSQQYTQRVYLADKPLAEIRPADITKGALEEQDPLCQMVLSRYCAILGNVCADMALVVGGVGGVYLCGGIIPRLIDFLRQSDFRQRFDAKGRFADYMKPIPVYVVTHPHPGLLGAAVALRQHLSLHHS